MYNLLRLLYRPRLDPQLSQQFGERFAEFDASPEYLDAWVDAREQIHTHAEIVMAYS
jgi:hypothetical protein